jgi:hypothetical protein
LYCSALSWIVPYFLISKRINTVFGSTGI